MIAQCNTRQYEYTRFILSSLSDVFARAALPKYTAAGSVHSTFIIIVGDDEKV